MLKTLTDIIASLGLIDGKVSVMTADQLDEFARNIPDKKISCNVFGVGGYSRNDADVLTKTVRICLLKQMPVNYDLATVDLAEAEMSAKLLAIMDALGDSPFINAENQTAITPELLTYDRTTLLVYLDVDLFGNSSVCGDDPCVPGFLKEYVDSKLEGYVSDPDYIHTDNNYTGDDKAKVTELSPLFWDEDNNTFSFPIPDGGMIQIGQEPHDYYTNLQGAQIVNGDIVSVVGAAGNRTAIALTDAANDAKALACFGMVTVATIGNNNVGRITKSGGKVRGVNTSGYAEGATIYVDPLNPGKWTGVKPDAPLRAIQIGVVSVSHAVNGVVELFIKVYPRFGELADVDGTTTEVLDAETVPVKKIDGLIKFLSWANIKATLKTYFDTLYEKISNKQNSLTADGTGVKYPTVDAVNAMIVGELGDSETKVINQKIVSEEFAKKVDNDNFELIKTSNLLNPHLSNFYSDKRLSANGGVLISNTDLPKIVTSKGIPVKQGESYCISGSFYNYAGGIRGVICPTNIVTDGGIAPSWSTIDGGRKLTSPVDGFLFVDFELNTELTALKSNSQITNTQSVIDYIEYGKFILNDNFIPQVVSLIDKVNTIEQNVDVLTIFDSFNKINPSNIKFDRRYSTGQKRIIGTDLGDLLFSGIIPVKEGNWYTVSGAGIHPFYQGGYFSETATGAINETSIDNITFVLPAYGLGRCFQVPIGLGIKYVAISLLANGDRSAIAGNAQLEEGEISTPYQAYSLVKLINPELLEGLTPEPAPATEEELKKYTTFGNLSYNGISDKFPNFREHFIKKDKNLCVVNTGTSLTARSTEHCTEHISASTRPPLMHSNNFATHIWDALKWEGQQYRRYDAAGFFTEFGSWITGSNVANWDDGAYRDGLTRYSDDITSQIQFSIPVNAWQFNFIYRADSLGSENCVISIAEGNGKIEVLNGLGAWVEANGYIFSQKELAVTNLPSVTYKDPNDGVTDVTITNYAIKGNTTYQKRLYMRCKSALIDSRNETKTVTVSRTSGRLLYWGVEWSVREFMITFINAARGSHSSAISSSALSLTHYQDNEIWQFNPDLLLTEDPIHNAGGGVVPTSSYNSLYYGRVTENFFLKSNGVSLKSRCETLGLTVPEMIIFNTTLTWGFDVIDADGNLKFGTTLDGLVWTALDSQSSCYEYISKNYTDVTYINAIKHFVKACYDCYGSMKDATIGSGKNGSTFTNEGSHWNDTGSKIMARVILPILDIVI